MGKYEYQDVFVAGGFPRYTYGSDWNYNSKEKCTGSWRRRTS